VGPSLPPVSAAKAAQPANAVELDGEGEGELLIGTSYAVAPDGDGGLALGDDGAQGRSEVAALEDLPGLPGCGLARVASAAARDPPVDLVARLRSVLDLPQAFGDAQGGCMP
jgi:hypothetical protein